MVGWLAYLLNSEFVWLKAPKLVNQQRFFSVAVEYSLKSETSNHAQARYLSNELIDINSS